MTPAEERAQRRKEWVANRLEAVRGVLNGDTDREWLTATGMTREPDCTCPYCQETPA